MELELNHPKSCAVFDGVFGEDFDRYAFPGEIYRVTSGHGGEALLIVGSAKTALIDCGMAYCGWNTVENIRRVLKYKDRNSLDYVFLTHSHYDHMGALSYVIKEFPECIVYGSEHCRQILARPNARKLIKKLGETARSLYDPQSGDEILVDNIRVNNVLMDGDEVSLGEEKIVALETRGHTDCSLTYVLEPLGLMFTSESTGILEDSDYINTPFLKSFSDSIASIEKCRAYKPDYICLSHFGMIPSEFNEKYWQISRDAHYEKLKFIKALKTRGLNSDEILEEYLKKYWNPEIEEEQPKEAFLINSENIIKAALREL